MSHLPSLFLLYFLSLFKEIVALQKIWLNGEFAGKVKTSSPFLEELELALFSPDSHFY